MTQPTCETCRFFQPRYDEVYGQCRRFSPSLEAQGKMNQSWPTVFNADWCGEHKPKETDDA